MDATIILVYVAAMAAAPAIDAVIATTRTRKVGGLRFVWCGRVVVSFCIRKNV